MKTLRLLTISLKHKVDFNEMIFDKSGYVWGINGRYVYSQKSNFAPISTKKNLSTIIYNNTGNIIVGSELGLNIIDKDNFELTRYVPNSPVTAKFSAIKVLSDGRLVGASSQGLSIKDYGDWIK
jgi:hypothetical protein